MVGSRLLVFVDGLEIRPRGTSFEMDCEHTSKLLGLYLDGELRGAIRNAVAEHLSACAACREEYEASQRLAADLADGPRADPPTELWDSIENRMPPPGRSARPSRSMLRSRAPLAVAAAIMLAVALGLLSVLGSFGGRAEAAPVNFAVILDALPLGPQEAFRKFLTLYQAEPSTPEQLRRFAPALDFNVPETLPGGFRRTAAYALDFGGRPGVAAAYLRDGEFLATIFHAPVRKEDFGTHKDYPCVVGQHRGQKVEVGEWQLVHLTDPTTCHCVLSRMDEDSQLPEVFAAIAPGSSTRNR